MRACVRSCVRACVCEFIVEIHWCLQVLLELGAPADVRDREGRTALHLAVGTGAIAALRVLIYV